MQRVVAGARALLVKIARGQGLSADLPYRYGVEAWAMVMRAGDYTVVHDHAHTHFSTAYYADAGNADLAAHPQSGQLTFVDPRRAAAAVPALDLYPAQFAIPCETGMLAVFPGWLQHFVHTYRGTRPRVSISCNVQLELEPTAS